MGQPTRSPSPAPDAVVFPRGHQGPKLSDRAREGAVELAEHLLGIDLDGPEVAWVRDQGDSFFATRDTADTLLFPKGHPREGEPRYRWEDVGEGVKLGWLAGS